MRLRLDLAYDGTDFHGWAAQPRLRTVQGTVEAALATALRTDQVRVVVAGRTDTGVHARGQVVHTDLDDGTIEQALSSRGHATGSIAEVLPRRLNGILPVDVRVRAVSVAPEGFDARFSAVWRRYAYRIADHPGLLDPLRRDWVLAWPRPLDLDAMNAAAEPLLGLQDFAAFCKQREGATTVRELRTLRWVRDDSGLAVATVASDAFCHNMVRALVGALVAIGEGRRPVTWAADLLQARRRDSGLAVIHAHGLTLEEVGYPADADLAEQAALARRRRSLEDDHQHESGEEP